jgi:hypothetical protein
VTVHGNELGGYWQSPWPGEDGGPRRRQVPRDLPHGGGGLSLRDGERLTVTSRAMSFPTMAVLRAPGEVFVQGNTIGAGATAWVERIEPETLATIDRSPDLPGGPFWPGGMAAHANGSLYVTFGRWCHRLAPDLTLLGSAQLPRDRPYNSLVVLPDGHLVMKDFDLTTQEPARVVVLDPETLEPATDELDVGEASIARLSADGNVVYVVGVRSVQRFVWDTTKRRLERDAAWRAEYRRLEGQGFGWDAVISDAGVWFLDNGEGTENFGGWFRGKGVATTPLHLVRAGLDDARDCALIDVCAEPGGIVANPPVYDASRRIAVGYDSGNGTIVGFDVNERDGARERWRRAQDHASHMVLWPERGELLTCDYHDGQDDVVVLDIATGAELARAATGSPLQSVLFPSPGWDRDAYYCSFSTLARVFVERV